MSDPCYEPIIKQFVQDGSNQTIKEANNEKQLNAIKGYRQLRDELNKTEGELAATKSQLGFLNTIQEKGGALTKDQVRRQGNQRNRTAGAKGWRAAGDQTGCSPGV